MTCPKCGLETLPEQRFCRSCGEALQKVTSRLPPVDRETRSAGALVLWGFILMFAGAAIGVVGKRLIYQDGVTVAGVLLSLLGMFLILLPYIIPKRQIKSESASPSSTNVLTSASPTKTLPHASVEFVPSVTERTTDLLEVSDHSAARNDKNS